MKLNTKLLQIFLLLSFIPLATIGFLAYENSRRSIERNTTKHLMDICVLKEAEFQRWLEGSTRRLRGLAQRPLVRQYAKVLAHNPVTDQDRLQVSTQLLEDHLLPALTIMDDWQELFLLHPENGQILVSTTRSNEGKFREHRPYFIAGRERTYVSPIYYSIPLEQTTMTIATPVANADGGLFAVLVGRIDLTEVSVIMQQGYEFDSSKESYLVNSFNFLVTKTRFSEGIALKTAIHTKGVEDCLQQRNGFGLYDNYRGIPVIGAYRWLPKQALCILTELDQSEAFIPIVTLRTTIVRIAVFATLAVILSAILFSRYLAGPFQRLVSSTEYIGRGDFSHRVIIQTRDEMGQLALSFNQMSENLQRITASRDDLNTEIAERAKVEERLLLNESRLEALVQLNHMEEASLKDISDFTLEQSVQLTNSRLGFLGFMDADENEMVLHAWSKETMQDCTVNEKPIHYPIEKAGLWGEAVRRREVLIVDDCSRLHTGKKGVPEGHVPLHNLLCVPIFEGDRIVMLVAVANKASDYDESDVQQLTLLLEGCWKTIQHTRFEEERELFIQELSAKNAELERFTYTVSHDLKSPLITIKGFLGMLQTDALSNNVDALETDIRYISEAADNMQELLEDLLDLSRIGRIVNPPELISLQNVLDEAIGSVAGRIAERGVRIAFGSTLPEVYGDHMRLREVFENLLDNAVKFMGGQEQPRIEIHLRDDGDSQLLSVHDNGIGIAPQYQEKIFGLFEKLNAHAEGTGVGLTTVKRIIELHGGRIWVESEGEGRGSTFYFTLRKPPTEAE